MPSYGTIQAIYRALDNEASGMINRSEYFINKHQSSINNRVSRKKILQRRLLSATGTRRENILEQINKINLQNKRTGKILRGYKKRYKTGTAKKWLSKKMIRKPHVSKLQGSQRDGYFIRNKMHPPIEISEENIPDIIDIITNKYENTLQNLSGQMLVDDNTIKNIRLVCSDEYGDHISSINVSSLDDLESALLSKINEHNPAQARDPPRGGAGNDLNANQIRQAQAYAYEDGSSGDGWYARFLYAIDFFMFNGVLPVGCASHEKKKFIYHLSHSEVLRLYCPKSKGNKCFDRCLGKAVGSKKQAHNNRRSLGIDLSAKINPKSEDGHRIADSFNVGYIAYIGIAKSSRVPGTPVEDSFKVYTKYKTDRDIVVELLLIVDHCFLINDKHIYKTKCHRCGDIRKTGIEKNHKCKNERVSYNQNDEKLLKVFSLKKDKTRSWVFFDLETLPCGKGETHCVYAVGWYDYQSKKYYKSYGKDCFDDFMLWINKNNNKQYIAFNGTRFDFYFIKTALLDRNIKIKNDTLSNGRILNLEWNNNSVWDLAQFMPGFSLEKACKAFGTKFQKSEFDHDKMKDWNDVDKYKNEVLPYLKLDVMSLCELTDTYVNECEADYNASPTRYWTLSSFGDNVWRNTLDLSKYDIEIPDMDKQKFISQSVYGGRTYPSQKYFKSSFYDKIKTESDVEKLKSIYNELFESRDFIYNADINSQYPAVMAGCDLINVSYPTGISYWIKDNPTQCELDFNNNKLGFFDISFVPNVNLRHAILPRKKGKGGVEWSLTPGSGIYNTIDIQNAVKYGYTIQFNGTALVYPTSNDTIFKSYIDLVYTHKVNAKNNNNDAGYAIAKLMMNSVFGKQLQRPISSVDRTFKNFDLVLKFMYHHVLTDWEIVENDDGSTKYMMVTGDKKDESRISKKPRQNGSLITAYSRRLYCDIAQSLDPSLTKHTITYSDTDCFHVLGKYYDNLKNANLIHKTKLGYVDNDCPNNALIFREINLSPKCYMYECLDGDGKIHTVMKSKGIMKKHLQENMFHDENKNTMIYCRICKREHSTAIIHWDGMKKINKRLSKSDRASGVEHWSVKKQSYTRTFNKNSWQGMTLQNNQFLPFGSRNICLFSYD